MRRQEARARRPTWRANRVARCFGLAGRRDRGLRRELRRPEEVRLRVVRGRDFPAELVAARAASAGRMRGLNGVSSFMVISALSG